MSSCSSCPSPMVTGKQFVNEQDELLKNPTIFRRLIGALQYVINTRSDITFSVNKLSRYLSKPTIKQWQAAKSVLRYLKGTLDYGIQTIISTESLWVL